MLEQKVKKALEEIGFSKKVAYKVGLVDIYKKYLYNQKHFLRICSAGLTVLLTPGFRLLSSSSEKRRIVSRFTTLAGRASRRMDGLSRKTQSLLYSRGYFFSSNKCYFRSRLGGQKPKEISSKLNFASFLDHYQSYPIAQQLFNKMIRLL